MRVPLGSGLARAKSAAALQVYRVKQLRDYQELEVRTALIGGTICLSLSSESECCFAVLLYFGAS
jgi:hypothetical protein